MAPLIPEHGPQFVYYRRRPGNGEGPGDAGRGGRDPSEAAMNPVLLKPTSHMGSQVIVNGEVLGNYSAAEYFKMKKA